MKSIELKHFERMKMMCKYFEDHSNTNHLYIPEYTAAIKINNLIETGDNQKSEIEKILKEIENIEHKNDSHWLDYKMHVKAYFNL